MNDMSQVIIPKADQISADDLLAGPLTIRINAVSIRPGTEQPVTINYDGDDGRPWKPCKSMSRVLVSAWGPDANAYVGRSLTLYRDPTVKWGGMEVGGIRVSHLSNIERDMVMALTVTKANKKPFRVKVLQVEHPKAPEPTMSKADQWFANLASQLDAAKTPEAVDAILGSGPVKKALEVGSAEGKARINEMARKSLERVAPVVEPAPMLELPSGDEEWMA